MHVAACLVVPIAWGAAVHVIFQHFGRPGRPDRRGEVAGENAGAARSAGDPIDGADDLAPEYQI